MLVFTMNPLPYKDTKPLGAADFYFGINATFRYIFNKFGMGALQKYWQQLGSQYHAPVAAAWRKYGLKGVAAYWEAFFKAEPGSEVSVTLREDSVLIEVRRCPAIHHLRTHQREIFPLFCQHCYFMGEATADQAGMTVRVEGGNGSCRQTFYLASAVPSLPPQDMDHITQASAKEVSC